MLYGFCVQNDRMTCRKPWEFLKKIAARPLLILIKMPPTVEAKLSELAAMAAARASNSELFFKFLFFMANR